MKKIFFAFVALLALSACVKDGMYPNPTVSNISNTVAYYDTDDVTVTATVSAFVNITKVNLVYNIGSAAAKEIAMIASGSTYTATIPAASMGTEVKYYIEAFTEGGSAKSAVGSYKVGEVPADYSKIKLNELNGNDKFIELINTGSEAVPIKGMTILKDSKADPTWEGGNYVMKAGEILLLWSEDVACDADGSALAGYDLEFVFHSGLSAKKAVRIELKDPKGNDVDDFNLVTVAKTAPASYSRVPDGTGAWCYTAATPGAKNATDNSDPVTGFAE